MYSTIRGSRRSRVRVSLGEFDGHVFHSTRWDHDVAVRGRRIAVIGNGSTGVQLVYDLP